jgi:hypothetical protein
MFQEASTREANREGDVLIAEFWQSVTKENIGQWCFERGIEMPLAMG